MGVFWQSTSYLLLNLGRCTGKIASYSLHRIALYTDAHAGSQSGHRIGIIVPVHGASYIPYLPMDRLQP